MSEPGLLSKTIAAARLVTLLRVAVSLLSLGSQVVLARLLLPEAFGKLAFLMVIVDLTGRLTAVQSEPGIIRERDDIQAVTDAYFTFQGLLTVPAALALVTFGHPLMAALGHPDLGFPLQVASAMLLTRWLRLPLSLAKRELEFRKVAAISIVGETLKSSLSIVMAYWGWGFWSLFTGALAGALSQCLLVWVLLPYRPKWNLESQRIKQMVVFGLPLTASGFLSLWYWRVDDLLVGRLLGEIQLGYYYLAFRIPHALLGYVENLDRVTYPAFAKADSEEALHAGFERVTHLSAILLFLPAMLCLVWGREIIVQVFGPQWEPATAPFQIFTCLIVFRGTFRHWANIAILKGKTGMFLRVVAVSAVLVSLLVYVLTPLYGIAGTAAAVAISMLCVVPLYLPRFKRLFPTAYSRILWRPAAAACATLSLGLLMKLVLSTLHMIGHVALISALYVAFLMLLDRDALRFIKDRVLTLR